MPSPTKSTDCTRARPRGAPQGLPCPRVAGPSRLSMAGKWRWSPCPRVAGPSLRGMAGTTTPGPAGHPPPRLLPLLCTRLALRRMPGRPCPEGRPPNDPAHGPGPPPRVPRASDAAPPHGGSATATPPMPAAPYAPLYAAPTPPRSAPNTTRRIRAGYAPWPPFKAEPRPVRRTGKPRGPPGQAFPGFPFMPVSGGPSLIRNFTLNIKPTAAHPGFLPRARAPASAAMRPLPSTRSHHAVPDCLRIPSKGSFFA